MMGLPFPALVRRGGRTKRGRGGLFNVAKHPYKFPRSAPNVSDLLTTLFLQSIDQFFLFCQNLFFGTAARDGVVIHIHEHE